MRAFSIVAVRPVCIRHAGVRFSQGPPRKISDIYIGDFSLDEKMAGIGIPALHASSYPPVIVFWINFPN